MKKKIIKIFNFKIIIYQNLLNKINKFRAKIK